MRALVLSAALCLIACGAQQHCTTAADCHLIEDTCACVCRAGLASEQAPTCSNPCQPLQPLCQGQLSPLCADGACVGR